MRDLRTQFYIDQHYEAFLGMRDLWNRLYVE